MLLFRNKKILSNAEVHSEDSRIVSYEEQSNNNSETYCALNSIIDTTNRPVAIAANGFSNGVTLGKIVNSNKDKFIGMLLNYQGTKNKLANNKVIIDNGLAGGSLNQKVYVDITTGFLSLVSNNLAVGKIVNLVPKQILINTGEESYVNLFENLEFLENEAVDKTEAAMLKINMFGANKYTYTAGSGIPASLFVAAIAYGDGKYVCAVNDAVDESVLYTSTDGITWTFLITFPINQIVRDIIFYKNKFILCGNNILKTSPDGLVWTTPTVNPIALTNLYLSITYSETRITIIGAASSNQVPTLYSLDDGVNWINFSTNFTPGDHLVDIAYGNDVYIGVTNYLGNGNNIQISTDECATWNFINQNVANLYGVCFGKNIFMAIGGNIIYSSYDNGLTWEAVNVGSTNFVKIAFLELLGLFIVVDFLGRILFSSDGVIWLTKGQSGIASTTLLPTISPNTKLYASAIVCDDKGYLVTLSSNNFAHYGSKKIGV